MKKAPYLLVWFLISSQWLTASEMQRADTVLLNGEWSFTLGDGTEAVETRDGQTSLEWRPVTLPGQFVRWSERAATDIKFVWVRREFNVSATQAKRMAVLRWNRIDYGATAFINGQKVGYNEPTGPYFTILPTGTLWPGKNQIVMKIPGAAGVRRSKSGHFLFPAGLIWGPSRPRMPAVTDDIWIEFADEAYMKWILAVPDVSNNRVRIRVTSISRHRLDGLKLTTQVRPWPKGKAIGSAETEARSISVDDPLDGEHCWLDVPLPDFKPWTHEECNLYTAEVRLARGEQTLDCATIRFGMREITVGGGNYQLNGRTLWLRGSNLVHEWDWGDVIMGNEHAYLVDEAREMSINCFRTHTQPPPKLWTDICDEHGTMILAEFPVLYNYRNHGYTDDEWDIFHHNAMADTAGWMSRLWNHPAVIMWVLSNESRNDNEWEAGPFRDFVVDLDPTRPTMRTGTTGTKTNYDVHTCGNTNHWTHEGQMHQVVGGWFRQAGDRTVTNSEYMNIFKRPKCQWTGNEDGEADQLAYAQIGMEHTEVMRRARLDAILPYMYAGWTRTRRGTEWKAGYAQPVSAAWHSALSPVLASLDLFDANYLTGQKVTTDVYLINDSWHNATIHVDLLLTSECPEFIPEAECFEKPLARWSFDAEVPCDSLSKKTVEWQLPDQSGNYWLTARTTGVPGRPILSQRFVRAIQPPAVPEELRQKKIVILGDDATREAWFLDRGLTAERMPDELSPDHNTVLIWDPGKLSAAEKKTAAKLCHFAANGGRIVVLSTKTWNWPELCHIQVDRTSGSRVFSYSEVADSLLDGIQSECLKRWNGLPGTVATASLQGPAVDSGQRLLWVRDPKHAVVAEISTASGDGTILFSQLVFRSHVLSTALDYDPSAEQMLINTLSD